MNAKIRTIKTDRLSASLRKWLWVSEILILLAVLLISLARRHTDIDFNPINGTYQNFNPIRRLLSGQIPMRDFQDYLGMGHLYLGAFMTVLFGGNYHASLYAFDLLAMLSTLLIFLVIGYCVLRDRTFVVTTTGVVFVILITELLSFCEKIPLLGGVIGILMGGMQTGNSARHIRGMIMPIVLALLLLALARKAKVPAKIARWLPPIGVGLIAGFAFVWSNDYGISCWVCLTLMTGWVSLSRSRKLGTAIVDVLVELAASLVSLFVFVGLSTQGNIMQWIQSTFGIGGYQRWYYNSGKAYYLFDLEYSLLTLLQAAVCIAYMVALFRDRGSREAMIRYGIPALANMICYCAANEYRLLSGNSLIEVARIALFVTLLFEVVRLFSGMKKMRTFMAVVFLVGGLSWIGFAAIKGAPNVDGVYMEKFGGIMTELGDDILATEAFLNGEEFWSTYASAQEVQQGTFQPSGTDYIIHVMGDRQREEYLNKFKTSDFRYTATIRESYNIWERWIMRANWFFYRELYENWHPVFANEYELYWERNSAGEDNVVTTEADVQIEWIGKATAVLSVHTEKSVNGVADVWMDYQVLKDDKSDWRRLVMLEPMLHVKNGSYETELERWYGSFNLRSQSAEYIPILIQDGYGEVTLSAYPCDNVLLEVLDVRCDRIFSDLTADYRAANDAD